MSKENLKPSRREFLKFFGTLSVLLIAGETGFVLADSTNQSDIDALNELLANLNIPDFLPFYSPVPPTDVREIVVDGSKQIQSYQAVEADQAIELASESYLNRVDYNNALNIEVFGGNRNLTAKNLIEALGSNISSPRPCGEVNVRNPFGRENVAFYGGWYRGHHTGVDLVGAFPYASMFDAEVINIGKGFHDSPDYGLGPNTIVARSLEPVCVNQLGDLLYAYEIFGHGSTVTEGLEKGSIVKAGEIMGISGNTGASTADHLHFEVALASFNAMESVEKGDTIRWKRMDKASYIDPNFFLRVAVNQTQNLNNYEIANQEAVYPELPDLHFEATGIYSDPEKYGCGRVEVNYQPFLTDGQKRYVVSLNINDGWVAVLHLDGQGNQEVVYQTQALLGYNLNQNSLLENRYVRSHFADDGSRYDGETGIFYDKNNVPRKSLTPPLMARVNGFERVYNFAGHNDDTMIAIMNVMREDGSVASGVSEYTFHEIPPVPDYDYRENELTGYQYILQQTIDQGIDPADRERIFSIAFSLGCTNLSRNHMAAIVQMLTPEISNGVEVVYMASYPELDQELLLKDSSYAITDDPFLIGDNDWYLDVPDEPDLRMSLHDWIRATEASNVIPNLNNLGRQLIEKYMSGFGVVGKNEFEEAVSFWVNTFPKGIDQRSQGGNLAQRQQDVYDLLSDPSVSAQQLHDYNQDWFEIKSQ